MSRPELKLGDSAMDSISGFKGIVVAITNWLHGCQRVTIAPKELKDGKPVDSHTFDAEQLKLTAVPTEPIVPSLTGGPRIEPTRNQDPR